MKRAAYRHPKMYDLAARLGIKRAHAAGIIQFLLDYTADAAPAGDIGKCPDAVIAMACDWDGDPGTFVDALVGAGWLDRCKKRRLVVHDLADHAESWWIARNKKAHIEFINAHCVKRKLNPNKEVTKSSERPLRPISDQAKEETGPQAQRPLLSPPLPSPSNPSPSLKSEGGGLEKIQDPETQATELVKLYEAKVTSRWGPIGHGKFRWLLNDLNVPFATIAASIVNFGIFCDREGDAPDKRPKATNFFSGGDWRGFVDGVPPPKSTGPDITDPAVRSRIAEEEAERIRKGNQ